MNKLTKEQLSSTIGHFSWDFGQNFFIETEVGNFVWSSPSYYGTNIICRFDGSLKDLKYQPYASILENMMMLTNDLF